MKKEVSYKAVISVTITALVSGFLLSFVFSSFEKDILANNEKTVLEGVKAVIIDSDTIEGPLTENSTFTYYIGKNLTVQYLVMRLFLPRKAITERIKFWLDLTLKFQKLRE